MATRKQAKRTKVYHAASTALRRRLRGSSRQVQAASGKKLVKDAFTFVDKAGDALDDLAADISEDKVEARDFVLRDVENVSKDLWKVSQRIRNLMPHVK